MPCVCLKSMSVCRLRALIAKPEIIKEPCSHNCHTKVRRNEKDQRKGSGREGEKREREKEKALWNVVLQRWVEAMVCE